MRTLKILGLILIGLVLFAGVAIAGVVIGGAPLISKIVENQGSALFGREIRVGRLEISWGRLTRIRAEHISVANAEWGSTPHMITIGRLDLDIELGALLGSKLVMPRIEIDDGSVLLETSTKGKGNWDPFVAVSGLGQRPQVRRVTIRNGSFRYRNGETGAETNAVADDLVAETPNSVSPIKVTGKGAFQQDPFALTAEVASVARLQSASKPYPIRLDGSLGENEVTLSGVVGDPLAKQRLDLRVEMDGQDIQQVLATLGVPIPKMPIYHLSGQVHRDEQQWRFEDVKGRVGTSLLAGTILVDTGRRVPYIRAALTSTYLDLADFKGLYGGDPNRQPTSQGESRAIDAAGKMNARVIPDVRLPIEKLLGFDADFSLDAPKVKPTAGLPIEHVTLGVSLKDGTLRLKPIRVVIARGEVLADIEYRSVEKPPRFRANIDLRHIDLARLFAGADVSNGVRQMAGVVGGFAKLRSEGAKQRQILAQLSGDIGLSAAGGKLGQKLGGAFENSLAEALGLTAKADEPPRLVNCLIGRVNVRSGIATVDTLLLDTAESVIVARGNVNVGDETLFLDVSPYPKRQSARPIGAPFTIRGTFAQPKVTADKGGLVARLGAAIGLGPQAPPAGFLQRVETDLGEANTCGKAASTSTREAGEGNSRAPRRLK